MVDLAVALAIDDTPCLALSCAACGPRKSATSVPMLYGFNVAEIPGEPIEL
jgi:hypothetical protein